MNKPYLLFAIKCSVILYFAACTSIDHLTIAKSATPVVTKGVWKVNAYVDSKKNNTNDFSGYSFTFYSSGEITANKNGVETDGNWSEDNISKRITINLGTTDPVLAKLNNYWDVKEINNTQIDLQCSGNIECSTLNIVSL